MDKSYQFKVAWCPICSQGWVEIVKSKQSNQLYTMCTECESEWDTPRVIDSSHARDYNEEGRVTEPSYEEVREVGWDKYIIET